MCKTLEAMGKMFDARLTTIAQKIDMLGKGQQEFNKKIGKLSIQMIE